jgi:hypothetical protein
MVGCVHDIDMITNSLFSLQHAAGGIAGMVIGMLVETLLFIIRTSNYDVKKGKQGKLKKTKDVSFERKKVQ